MAKVHLSGSEKRALLLWVLAGIIGLWYAHRNFFVAFPEASVDFKVTRAQALTIAKEFVESQGQSTAGYQSAIVFGNDDEAKTYLERQVGLKEANELMASTVNVWHWQVRFFKPAQEEEFGVLVSPEGKIKGYEHAIPEAQSGERLTKDSAETIAKNFLVANLAKSASDWDYLPEEANSITRSNRLDWSFTWERHGFRAKDAPERLKIVLQGDHIGEASEALKVPDQWRRDYATLRSHNILYNQIAIIPYFFFFIATLVVGIRLTIKNQTSWGLALRLGVIVAILLTAMQLNRWPVDLIHYDTNTAYGSFALKQIMGAVAFGLLSALTVTLVLPGGEPLYRKLKPQLLQLKHACTLRGLKTKEFFSSCVVGLSLAGAHMGFLTLFYLIANHYGAWSPQEVNYEDSVSTAIPWISGIAIGLLAATSEEFLFRLFAIPFLQNLTKSRILAIILPAFSWGFLHAAYPNEPPYIRGLEVGLIGIVAGIVMLRWGILATLVWHYTVDASLVGLLLIRSSSWYFRISGVVIALAVLIPLGVGVVARIRRGAFEDDEDLLNRAADVPILENQLSPPVSEPSLSPTKAVVTAQESPAPTLAAHRANGLSASMIGLLCACIVLGGLAAWKLKPVHLGDYLKLSLNAKDATAHATEVLQQRNVDPKTYRIAPTFVSVADGMAAEYLREKIGVAALNEIYDKQVPAALWDVRFFRDSQPEEYSVILRPDGSLHSVHHEIAEAAAGASLSKEEALAKAQAYLRDVKNIDLSQWTMEEAASEKKPNRLDHKLTWQKNQPLDDPQATLPADATKHAFPRVQLLIVGDEVTSYRTFIQIPDEWRRKHDEQSVARTVLNIFPWLCVLGFAGTAAVFFLREIKSPLMREVPWKRLILWGLVGLAAYILVIFTGDQIPQQISRYQTSMPLKFLFGGLGIGFLIGGIFYLAVIVVLFGMAWFFLREAEPGAQFLGWTGMPGWYYRDALLIGLGGTAALVGFRRIAEWLSLHWPTQKRAIDVAFGNDFDAYFPMVSISATAVFRGLLFTGLIAVTASFLWSRCKSPILRALLFLLGSLALVSGWGSAADFAKQWVVSAIFLAIIAFGVTYVARLNLLGYFLVLAIPVLFLGASELFPQPNGYYHAQGIACLVALGVLLIWPLAAWLTSKSGTEPRTSP